MLSVLRHTPFVAYTYGLTHRQTLGATYYSSTSGLGNLKIQVSPLFHCTMNGATTVYSPLSCLTVTLICLFASSMTISFKIRLSVMAGFHGGSAGRFLDVDADAVAQNRLRHVEQLSRFNLPHVAAVGIHELPPGVIECRPPCLRISFHLLCRLLQRLTPSCCGSGVAVGEAVAFDGLALTFAPQDACRLVECRDLRQRHHLLFAVLTHFTVPHGPVISPGACRPYSKRKTFPHLLHGQSSHPVESRWPI